MFPHQSVWTAQVPAEVQDEPQRMKKVKKEKEVVEEMEQSNSMKVHCQSSNTETTEFVSLDDYSGRVNKVKVVIWHDGQNEK